MAVAVLGINLIQFSSWRSSLLRMYYDAACAQTGGRYEEHGRRVVLLFPGKVAEGQRGSGPPLIRSPKRTTRPSLSESRSWRAPRRIVGLILADDGLIDTHPNPRNLPLMEPTVYLSPLAKATFGGSQLCAKGRQALRTARALWLPLVPRRRARLSAQA